MIRQFKRSDIPSILEIWNQSVAAGEVVYAPMTEALFTRKFLAQKNSDERYYLIAEEEGKVQGFLLGMEKKTFLPGETAQNTPGYLEAIFVRRDARGSGTGAALLQALEERFHEAGKRLISCGGMGPLDLDWRIPGTPGHDHNSVPGMDEGCVGYPFLEKNGYRPAVREVALYLNLADYQPWEGLARKKEELAEKGIHIGPYDASLGYDYDGMCDRVGSEYWREVLRSEIASHLAGEPNPDPRLWPDGRKPAGPRPILVATCEPDRAIVAQAGPVDVQESGRGWFTGICTDPLYERMGIASVLFNTLMQEFIARGAKFSTIFTGVENHARKVYERTGFREARTFAIMRKQIAQ